MEDIHCNCSGNPGNGDSICWELNLWGFCSSQHTCSGQHRQATKEQIQNWQKIHGKKRPERRNQNQRQRRPDMRKYSSHNHSHRGSNWSEEKDAKRRAYPNIQTEFDDFKEANRKANESREQKAEEDARKAKLKISDLEKELADIAAESRKGQLQCDTLGKELEPARLEHEREYKKLHKQQTEFLKSMQKELDALKAMQSRTPCSIYCEVPDCPMNHGGPTNLQLKKAPRGRGASRIARKKPN
jgi:hypothetical protein